MIENYIIQKLEHLEQLVRRIVEPDQWMDIKEAVKYSHTSNSTLYRAVRKATLKCSKRTGKLLFRRSAIDRWLDG